jgi:hypothetical protein
MVKRADDLQSKKKKTVAHLAVEGKPAASLLLCLNCLCLALALSFLYLVVFRILDIFPCRSLKWQENKKLLKLALQSNRKNYRRHLIGAK